MADSSDGEGDFNPYSAPKADLRAEPVPSAANWPASEFYRMSIGKLWIMSILSLGLYHLCFWWRHWRARRDAGDQLSVFWRTVFSPFMIFSYASTLKNAARGQGVSPPSGLSVAPGLYFLVNIFDQVSGRLELPPAAFAVGLVTPFVSAWCLVQVQEAANALTGGEEGPPMNRGITWGSVVVGGLGACLWLFAMAAFSFPEAFAE